MTISKVMTEDKEKCSENLQPSINKHSREVLLENDALFSNFRSTTKMKNFNVSSICHLWHLSNLSLNCIWALVQITLMWSLSALPLPLKLDFFENSSSLDSRGWLPSYPDKRLWSKRWKEARPHYLKFEFGFWWLIKWPISNSSDSWDGPNLSSGSLYYTITQCINTQTLLLLSDWHWWGAWLRRENLRK